MRASLIAMCECRTCFAYGEYVRIPQIAQLFCKGRELAAVVNPRVVLHRPFYHLTIGVRRGFQEIDPLWRRVYPIA